MQSYKIKPCNLVERYEHFGRICCLLLWGRSVLFYQNVLFMYQQLNVTSQKTVIWIIKGSFPFSNEKKFLSLSFLRHFPNRLVSSLFRLPYGNMKGWFWFCFSVLAPWQSSCIFETSLLKWPIMSGASLLQCIF
jgi:hypothetical protein